MKAKVRLALPRLLVLLIGLALMAALMPSRALGADDAKTSATQSRYKFYGHADVGVTYNYDRPRDHINFGRLFDDRSNQLLLNQILLTTERPLDTTAKTFDWGYKLQVMVGTDARYTRMVGEFDRGIDNQIMPDVVEAYLNTHFPVLTPGGIDLKVGQFVTLEGAEYIDSTSNFFYSHSYIFNFGIPLKHLGAMATAHVNKNLDLFAGITRGVNTSFTDNNDELAFHGGVGLNLWDGKAIITATTHIGAENPHDNENLRYLNDITAVIKLTEKLTATTDLNYAREDSVEAQAYGIAQYFTYAFSDKISAGIRGEVFRDDSGFFVAQFQGNNDFLNLQRGDLGKLHKRSVGGGATTYGALTVGLNYKPIPNLLIRPEIRYDNALNGNRPFNDSKDRDMLTGALAVTYSF